MAYILTTHPPGMDAGEQAKFYKRTANYFKWMARLMILAGVLFIIMVVIVCVTIIK